VISSNNTNSPLRVFLLGPSHHAYIEGCGLSKLGSYETPIGNIELDEESRYLIKMRANCEM